MRTLIEGYQNDTGDHCGSSAMRSLLRFYTGMELSEAMVFGLGSGLDTLFIDYQGRADPPVVAFGRAVTMELDVASALGLDYREQPEPNDAKAWAKVRDEVLAGRPTMLSGDLFYLDYRDFKVHFPAHRFVLLGFDDEQRVAFVGDRIAPEPQACSYEALAKSRNPPSAMTTFNLWGRFVTTEVKRPLEEAVDLALKRNADRMLGRDDTQGRFLAMFTGGRGSFATGLAAIDRLATELPGWTERDDLAELTRYLSSTFEAFGTGGGNFRRLYARFLAEARELLPDRVPAEALAMATEAADLWTGLSKRLAAIDADAPAEGLSECAVILAGIRDLEQWLFETLAG